MEPIKGLTKFGKVGIGKPGAVRKEGAAAPEPVSEASTDRKPAVCSQVTCDQIAVASYVWPGQAHRSFACKKHMDMASGVAAGMGFILGDVRMVWPDQGGGDG